MGKGSDAPDTLGAARETGEQAYRLNEAQTAANRPDQYNPWGSVEWTPSQRWNPVTGAYETAWQQRETLDPDVQSALDAQMAVQAGRSNLAEGIMGRAWEDYQTPFDFDQYGNPIQMADVEGINRFDFGGSEQRQRAEDAAYQRAASRLDPQFDRRQQDLEIKLRNQGLAPGDQAYDAAMTNLGRERSDAYEAARLGSIGEGRIEQQQEFQQALAGTDINRAIQSQQFGQAAQQAEIANALRQQQIQEDLGRRGFNLSEVERLLQGQQIEGGPPGSGGETDTIASQYLGGG